MLIPRSPLPTVAVCKQYIDVYTCNTYTAYCIWRVMSPISSLYQLSSPLRLFCHVPLKRDQLDWDWRI